MKRDVGNVPEAWVKESVEQWMAVGHGLALCPPAMEPWKVIGVADRATFLKTYVLRYVKADVARRPSFRQKNPAAYERILLAWDIDG